MKFRSLLAIIILEIYLRLGITFGQEETAVPLELQLPKINQKSFNLNPSGQTYTLLIDLPNGSIRNETVELRAPNTPNEELHVDGETTNYYPGASLTVTYEAGKYGYRVKYKYINYSIGGGKSAPKALSEDALKSLGG